MKYQSGNTLVVGLIVTVVILAVIGLVASKFSSMQKALEEKSGQIASLTTSLEEEKQRTKELSETIAGLNRQIELHEKNEKDAEALRQKNADTISKLEKKVRQLTNDLPPVLQDHQVAPETSLEKQNSEKRILQIWELYRYGINAIGGFEAPPGNPSPSPSPEPVSIPLKE